MILVISISLDLVINVLYDLSFQVLSPIFGLGIDGSAVYVQLESTDGDLRQIC